MIISPPLSHIYSVPTPQSAFATHSPTIIPIQPQRKSTRATHPPPYLNSYHHHLSSVYASCQTDRSLPPSFPLYPLANFVSYSSLSPSHRHFALTVSSHIEPQSYHDATTSPLCVLFVLALLFATIKLPYTLPQILDEQSISESIVTSFVRR